MQSRDENKGREDHGEGTRRLFQQWFGDQAEEVAEAILLDHETYGGAEDSDDEAGPAFSDEELASLMADVKNRARRIGDEQDRPPLKSISGGTVDRPFPRRETHPRRFTAYNRGPTNVLQAAVAQAPTPIGRRMHMDAADGGQDYALDLTPYREWLDTHGAGWVGSKLLLFSLEAGRMVRVTTERDEAKPAADLIVELIHKDGRQSEVRLTATENEAALDLEDRDVGLADWPCSISLKIEQR